MNSRSLIMFAIGLVPLLLLINTSYAYTGVENITLSKYSATLLPGGSVSTNYNLTLSNGYYTFGTNLYVVAEKQLSSNDNITVLLTENFGNPPTGGVMYIFLGATTEPGTYNITLAGNSTGAFVNAATFELDVVQSIQNTSSTTTTKHSTATTSLGSTTVPSITYITTVSNTGVSKAKVGTNPFFYVIIALIVVAIIVMLFIAMRGRKT